MIKSILVHTAAAFTAAVLCTAALIGLTHPQPVLELPTTQSAQLSSNWWVCNPGNHWVYYTDVSVWQHYGYSCYIPPVFTR
jgi:hypothetical protein